MGHVYLAIAIISEVIATSALKSSNGFSNLLPSIYYQCLLKDHFSLSDVLLGSFYFIEDTSRLLYIESRIDYGKTLNDDQRDNQITTGIRWDFDL